MIKPNRVVRSQNGMVVIRTEEIRLLKINTYFGSEFSTIVAECYNSKEEVVLAHYRTLEEAKKALQRFTGIIAEEIFSLEGF